MALEVSRMDHHTVEMCIAVRWISIHPFLERNGQDKKKNPYCYLTNMVFELLLLSLKYYCVLIYNICNTLPSSHCVHRKHNILNKLLIECRLIECWVLINQFGFVCYYPLSSVSRWSSGACGVWLWSRCLNINIKETWNECRSRVDSASAIPSG